MINVKPQKFDYSQDFNEVPWLTYAHQRGLLHDTVLILDFLEHTVWSQEITEQFKEPLEYLSKRGLVGERLDTGSVLRVFYEKMPKTEENNKFVAECVHKLLHDTNIIFFFNYPRINETYGLAIENNNGLWEMLKTTPAMARCNDNGPWSSLIYDVNKKGSAYYLKSARGDELRAAVSDKDHYLGLLIDEVYMPSNAAKIIDSKNVNVDYYNLRYALISHLDTIEKTYIDSENKLGFYLTQLKLNEQAKDQDGSENQHRLGAYARTEKYLIEKLIENYPKEYEAYLTLQSINPGLSMEVVLKSFTAQLNNTSIPDFSF